MLWGTERNKTRSKRSEHSANMSQTGETQLGDCAEEFHDCSQASSTSELDAARRDDSRHEEVGISAVSWNAATEVCVHKIHPS